MSSPIIYGGRYIYNSCGNSTRKTSGLARRERMEREQMERDAYQAWSPNAHPPEVLVTSPYAREGSRTPIASRKSSLSRPLPPKQYDDPPSPTPAPKRLKMSATARALLNPGPPLTQDALQRHTEMEATTATEPLIARNLFKKEVKEEPLGLITDMKFYRAESVTVPEVKRVRVLQTTAGHPSTTKPYPTGLGLGRPSQFAKRVPLPSSSTPRKGTNTQ